MYNMIKERFTRKFPSAENLLNEEDLFIGNKKTIPAREWLLKVVMQENEDGPYVEYYAIHGTGGHLHERIYSNGKEEQLEVLRQYIAYSPNIPGDRERSAKDCENFNRRLMCELRKQGLM
ncbi:hypothetical protein [Cellulosilyticum lentocellum]|uniref:Uncharacterized protein n=1 Tax=Cellulosilyticum lentocellum (strain ATCC 49066 / DSM 5427 / NCIMB 11756 / RHM5) TaxID=642492 RepID=F2JRR0_CELLD|nr:hypothetical protein [Cellulosilyticum lentocellum]ADZ85090.1 hypothetical protein Clole_3403 [Cellulosilyticum lentocellum DSM 5427]